MKLQRLQDVRICAADVVFRESSLHKAVAVVVFFAATIGLWIAAGFSSDGGKRWLLGLMGASMLLFAWIFFSILKKTLAAANWLVRLTAGGDVTVKFRSFANAHFPPEDVVAFTLNRSEIKWVPQSSDRITTLHGDDGGETVRRRYLDLAVDDPSARQIEAQIQIERRREAPETGRIIKSRTWVLDYPVSVVEGHIIRIEWRGKSARVTPKLTTAIELLAKHTKVEPEPDEGVMDYTSATRDDEEDKILALIESGDKIGAIALARKVYNCPLAEATHLVDGLVRKERTE